MPMSATVAVLVVVMVVMARRRFRALWMAQVPVRILMGMFVDVPPVPMGDDQSAHCPSR